MMARCKGTATGTHGLCWAHAPENAERRRRMASKAAKSKPNRELRDLKALLSDLTARVLAEEGADPLETGRAAVANQLINTCSGPSSRSEKTRKPPTLRPA